MLKKCAICGKGPQSGKALVRKGLPKKQGGGGSKIARASKRKFLPNLQRIHILVGKTSKRVYVCTKCMKKGDLIRPKK